MQGRPPLGQVDRLAAEHGLDPRAQLDRARQVQEQPQGLVGDALLRVVEVEAGALGREALAALGIRGEEIAQMLAADVGPVRFQRLPGRQRPESGLRCHRADVPAVMPGPRGHETGASMFSGAGGRPVHGRRGRSR